MAAQRPRRDQSLLKLDVGGLGLLVANRDRLLRDGALTWDFKTARYSSSLTLGFESDGISIRRAVRLSWLWDMKMLSVTATLAASPMIVFVFAMKEVRLEKPVVLAGLGEEEEEEEEDEDEAAVRVSSPRRLSPPQRVSVSSGRRSQSGRQESWWTLGSWGFRGEQNHG
jgi:hypothetical protein